MTLSTPYNGCPADLGLAGWDVTVTNGTTSEDNPLLPSDTTFDITTGTTGTTSVSVVALCGSGASQIQSDPSPPLKFPIG